MFKLNLLPPEEIKRIELTKFAFLLISFGIRLGIILAIFVIILATTYFSLLILVKGQDNSIEARQNDEKIQYQMEVEGKIESINQEAKNILDKQDKLIVWTPIMENLSKVTPDGVYLINFSYRASNDQINITGWARNRDKLLSFENSLKDSMYFEDVDSPLSNLIKQSDINFSFTTKPMGSLKEDKEE